MSEWLRSYERLPEASKVNVQRWMHLNKFIANTLRIPEQTWFETYLGDAMKDPLDYRFMEACIPGLSGAALPGEGESFELGAEFGGFDGPKVPLRAENNMGKLSPDLQDTIASMLEAGEPEAVKLSPADVAQLQKMFRSERRLAKLKRPNFRKLTLAREADEMTLQITGGDEILRMNLMEFSAILSRPLL